MLGRPDEARAYYQQALTVCEKVRFRPEVALICLELAELALSYQQSAIRGRRSAASSREARLTADKLKADGLEHLEFAIEEFRAMKMQPSLERALALKVQLQV